MDWHGYVFLGKNRPTVKAKRGELMLPPGNPFLTEQVRTQLTHVLLDAVGSGEFAQDAWGLVVGHYDREMGTTNLGADRHPPQWAVEAFLAVTDDVTDLDLTALGLIVAEEISNRLSSGDIGLLNVRVSPFEAVKGVNRFLREANVRYQFEGYRWVDVSSGYVHEQVIRPALDALDRPGFAGALEEFKAALDRLREGKTKDAATEATKALESTVKCICVARGWNYPLNANAKQLFDVIAGNGLVPTWVENGFIAAATIRNKRSAHGQGKDPQPLAPHLAELAVNLAASHIVALIAAHDEARPV